MFSMFLRSRLVDILSLYGLFLDQTRKACGYPKVRKRNNPYFEQMVGQIYPTELQLNKANSSDTVKSKFLLLKSST